MNSIKIIPCLDIKDGRVVKGIKFVDLRDARDPVEAAKCYSQEGADEIVFLDIAASVEARQTRLDWVKKVAEAVTVPFTVGGGIRNLEDMETLFDIGADKVSINTVAVENPELIKQSAEKFGNQCIVVAIDAKRQKTEDRKQKTEKNLSSDFCHLTSDSKWEVLIYGGNKSAGLDIVKWAKKVECLGAGEILLTSKDADGTKEGYDIEMTKAVTDTVSIPVTASGGAGKLEHLYDAATKAGAAAVLCASVFHFGEISIKEAKEYLQSRGVPVN